MRSIIRKLLVFITLAPGLPAVAGVTVIDFDSDSTGTAIVNGQIVNTEYQSDGVTINSVNYIDGDINSNNREGLQIAFDTSLSGTVDPDLEYNNDANDYDGSGPYGYTALEIDGHNFGPTPDNVLILQENTTGCSGDNICDEPDDEGSRAAGYFDFSFSNIVSILNIDFFDVEDQNGNDQFNAIHFFDENDNEIHLGHFTPTMGDGQFVRQSFSGIDGVKRLEIHLPGSGAIDNLAFRTTDIPEPPLTIAFALAALLMTRRFKK